MKAPNNQLLNKSSRNVDNIQNVFSLFRMHYYPIPLETFSGDPYRVLISTLLSSRTNDDITLPASQRLFKRAPDIKSLNQLKQSEIGKLIYPVGFYQVKSKQLKKLSNIIIHSFNGQIPSTRDELISLPGVGRKTANLTLNRAFAIPAIAVDTHVHRISNLIGWVNTKTPLETELKLEKFLPKKYWSEINRLFVSIGRQHRSRSSLLEFLKNNNLI